MTQPAATPEKLPYNPEVARSLRPMVDAAALSSIREWTKLKTSPIKTLLVVQPPYPVWMVGAALASGATVEELLACGAVRVLADPEKNALPSGWQGYLDPIAKVRPKTVFLSLFGPAFGQPYYLLEKAQ